MVIAAKTVYDHNTPVIIAVIICGVVTLCGKFLRALSPVKNVKPYNQKSNIQSCVVAMAYVYAACVVRVIFLAVVVNFDRFKLYGGRGLSTNSQKSLATCVIYHNNCIGLKLHIVILAVVFLIYGYPISSITCFIFKMQQ